MPFDSWDCYPLFSQMAIASKRCFFYFSISTIPRQEILLKMLNSSLGGNLTSGLRPCLRREARFNGCRDEYSRRHETAIWNIVRSRPLCVRAARTSSSLATSDTQTINFTETPVCEGPAT
jgi:hypothetical protein